MEAEEQTYKTRITINPDILVGKPVITGTRIPVYLISTSPPTATTSTRSSRAIRI